MKTCILLSTCDAYRPLADFTRDRIAEFWADAPPIRVCGLADAPGALPARADAGNWMLTTLAACQDLRAEGFEAAYLLLEDHPPLGPCHATHLNATLPAMMAELGAVSIALSGYGQGRKVLGTMSRWRKWELDRCRVDTLWKFPLHPALWRLDALQEILERLIAWLPANEQTPWAFERKGGSPEAGLPESLTTHSYRIAGHEHAATPLPQAIQNFRSVTDLYRFSVRTFVGPNARAAVDDLILGGHHYYHGPYPLVWSGLMRKGAPNPNTRLLFALLGRREWSDSLANMTFR